MLLMEEQYIYIYNCIWLEVEKIEVLVELSTYLFVCVLRRSFTSISKISFWLKLDFNLSANAVMLLKKTHPPSPGCITPVIGYGCCSLWGLFFKFVFSCLFFPPSKVYAIIHNRSPLGPAIWPPYVRRSLSPVHHLHCSSQVSKVAKVTMATLAQHS